MRHRTRSKSICYYLLNLVMYTLKEIIFTTVEYRERKDKEREEAGYIIGKSGIIDKRYECRVCSGIWLANL